MYIRELMPRCQLDYICCEIPDASNVTQRVCVMVEFETYQRDYVTTMTTMITPGMHTIHNAIATVCCKAAVCMDVYIIMLV